MEEDEQIHATVLRKPYPAPKLDYKINLFFFPQINILYLSNEWKQPAAKPAF